MRLCDTGHLHREITSVPWRSVLLPTPTACDIGIALLRAERRLQSGKAQWLTQNRKRKMEFRKYNSDELVVVGRRGCSGRGCRRRGCAGECVVVEDVQVEGAVVVVGRGTGTPGPSDGCTRTLWTRGSSLEARETRGVSMRCVLGRALSCPSFCVPNPS